MNTGNDSRWIPIPFTAQMVRAVLADEKTETRRAARFPGRYEPTAEELDNLGDCETVTYYRNDKLLTLTCPYGGEGDRLWVREAFRLPSNMDPDPAQLLAERHGENAILGVMEYVADQKNFNGGRTRNARFMPRWASRVSLLIREYADLERLRDITDKGARAEGIVPLGRGWGLLGWDLSEAKKSPREAYLHLFQKINPTAPADANPWVWVVKFARIREGA